MFYRRYILRLGLLALCALPFSAAANDDAYTPIFYKGLSIEPKLSVKTSYNDNIYATSNNEKTDFIVSINPSLTLTKKYDSASVKANFAGMIDRYRDHTNENRAGYSASLDYEQEINKNWRYDLGTSYESRARGREDPTDLAAASEPLYIDTLSAHAGVTRTFNRLSLTLQGQYDNITNENGVALLNPATPVNFSQNDRDQYTGSVKLAYELVPGGDLGSKPEKSIYLLTSAAQHDYDELPGATVSRDRNRYSILAGFEGLFKSLNLSTDFGIGYLIQKFEEAGIDDTGDIDFFAKLKYTPSLKYTLSFDVNRDVTEDTTILQGVVETDFSLASDYELFHNIYLNSRAAYEINDFENGREDKDKIGDVGLSYKLDPKLESRIGANYTVRDSNDPTSEFDRTVFMLQLIGKL